MTTCPACGHENPRDARFCNACAAPLARAGVPREQRKVVTVLFCDVTGSTQLGERLDPEAFRTLLARYFERMRGIVEAHGGSVEKFIGDAVMAVFGVPAVHEDDAIRALRAAAEMRDAFADLGVGGRIGVATGEVVTGTSERLVTGDAVNVAARLQQAAQPGDIILSAQTAALAGRAAKAEPLEPLRVKGKEGTVEAFRLIATTAESDRGHTTPMVGRTRQRVLLQDVFDTVRVDRSCHLFTLIGAAGVGKSRLTAEFLTTARDATVVRGRCLSYGEGITYWPVVEIFKQLPDRPADPVAAAAVATLLGESSAPTTPDAIAWAARKTFEQAAARAPLVCVFDDIHWAEPALLDLIEHVADLSRGAPIMLLCSARPELMDRRPSWAGGKLNATTVLLEPLSTEESAALIGQLMANGGIDNALCQRVADAAEGNPLFIEEMIALVFEDASADLAAPPTIRALLAARLDQLEQADRIVLERAAVEGKVFHQGAVQALTPEEAALPQRLQTLVRKELVRPEQPVFAGEDAFRFRHQLIRDAAYDGLPKGVRAELHARFAEWLATHSQRLVEFDEMVGYHLEQACAYRGELGLEPDPAWTRGAHTHLVAAGRRALLREDHHAASGLLGRASALEGADLDVTLELDLANALADSGDFQAALRSIDAAAPRARLKGDAQGASCLRIERARLDMSPHPEGAVQALRELIRESQPAFDQADYDLGLCVCAYALGTAEHMVGHADAAAAAFDQARAQAHGLGLPHLEARMLDWCMNSRKDGSVPAPEFLVWLDTVPTHARSTASFIVCQAEAYAMTGRGDQARDALRQLRGSLEDRGARFSLAILTGIMIPEVELLLGDPDAALRSAIRGCEVLDELAERAACATAAGFVAEAAYRLDRIDEADTWATRTAELSASDDAVAQLQWRLVRAKVLARRGAHEDAATLIRDALQIAGEMEVPQWKGVAHADVGEVLSLQGRTEEAREARIRALELFRKKGNQPAAGRLEAMLASPERPAVDR